MKNINNTEEQLYNQFMAELEDGAKEYDRMMAEREAPALMASQPKVNIISIARWAAIAACFVGLIIGSIVYFINENTVAPQHAIADNSRQKVHENNTTKGDVNAVNNIAALNDKKQDTRKIITKKDIDNKNKGGYECILPDIVLNIPNTNVENYIPTQYTDTGEEYNFDVVCYNMLPEINMNDNETLNDSYLEIKQICDNIYYNDVKPFKHLQQ